ncbi:KH domain-containing protein [Clostridium sp. MCC353]|uniref:RNA-binding cell elongation regulator Jag/EloR n=1 Tax=Clostridium sp. MCC353 TaxID=2592646 RepID=UPI001C0263D3|nr:RNA-binding cell elongation regulator Jag/EloR [Clostridium sp. MCC353]MBT9775401.1 KH domain-containing protein [Clostridium sp. MCC353]
MNKTITVHAKTVDEAITKAAIELGTASDNIHYDIIEKGSTGLFGFIGAKDAVISARVLEPEERAEKEAAKVSAKQETKAVVKEEKKSFVKEEKKTAVKESAKAEKKFEKRAEKAEKKPEAVKPEVKKTAVKETVVKESAGNVLASNNTAAKEGLDPAGSAVKFLKDTFAAMGMEVQIDALYNEGDRELTVNMAGDDMGILIGKRGQTLDSLQYLVSLVVNKENEGYVRVKLDTENYRERRKETLETLAKNIAYKVKRTKRSVSLEPMNPYERRIIHSALQSDRYVVTRSEGEEPFRHVVISLKRENSKKERYNSEK